MKSSGSLRITSARRSYWLSLVAVVPMYRTRPSALSSLRIPICVGMSPKLCTWMQSIFDFLMRSNDVAIC